MVRRSNEISREILLGNSQIGHTEPAPPKGPPEVSRICRVGSQNLHSSDEAGQHKPVEQREVGRLMRDV